ncbi:stalk domain-containing protein [Paenibacillus sp. GCM10027626]|uniref:stalk domain-containing protein n=1 Tax=Paenibacillus sp. GCM10027626 TaxID=3273411 RepID=UPI0036352746
MRRINKLAAAVLSVSFLAWGPGMAAAAAAGKVKNEVLDNRAGYEVITEAGTGEVAFRDGAGGAFYLPSALLYESKAKRLLVADTYNQRLRAVENKRISTVAGTDLGTDERGAAAGGLQDGVGKTAAFDHPAGIAADSKGKIYVADSGNHAIRAVDAKGQVSTVAGNGLLGFKDGKGEAARFYNPLDVAVAADGTIYVADTLNHVIRKIAGDTVTTLNAPSTRVAEVFPGLVEPAGDYADGPLKSAKFNEPSGLAIDGKGNLYVSDTGNQRIRYIDFAAGTVTTVAGGEQGKLAYPARSLYAEGGFADGAAAEARFNAPRGLAFTPDGGLLIADSLNHVIRYLYNDEVITVAGQPGESGKADGPALAAAFNRPLDVERLGDGRFAVADSGNSLVRMIIPFQLPAGGMTASGYKLVYNKELLTADAPPIAKNGTIFVPVRVLTERLGYSVAYRSGQAILGGKDVNYTVEIGSKNVAKTAVKAGQKTFVALAEAPFSRQNRLYVPVRFFAEELGLDVKWLAKQQTILIRDTYS